MRENKLSTVVSQQLVSSLNSVKTLVNTAINHPDLLHSKSKTMQSLSSAVRDLDVFNSRCLRDKSTLHIRRQVKHLHNSVSSLAQAVDADDIDVDSFLEELRDDVAVRVEAIEALAECDPDEIDLESDSVTLDDFESDSAGNSVTHFGRTVELGDMQLDTPHEKNKRRYAQIEEEIQRTKNTIKHPDTGTDKRRQLEAKLGRLEVELNLLRKEVLNTSPEAEVYRSSVTKLDNYDRYRSKLLRALPTAGSVTPVQIPVMVRFSSSKLNTTKALEAVFPKKVDVLGMNALRSSDISTILRDQIVLQFSKEAALDWTSDTLKADPVRKRSSEANKIVNGIKRELAALETELEELREFYSKKPAMTPRDRRLLESGEQRIIPEITTLQAKLKEAKEKASVQNSVKRAKVKTGKDVTNTYFSFVSAFLRELGERGKDYTMLSSIFIPSPQNPDIILAWVVTAAQARKLSALSNGNNGVMMWGLPWTLKQAKRSHVAPESLERPTKLGRG